MTTQSTIVMTGCDARFYPFMEETLKSLLALGIDGRADLGILDLGLTPEQLDSLRAMGCIIRKPEWTLPVPEALRIPHEIGLVARTALRDYFPGYKVYLWFDADAWAQTTEFFDAFVEGAKSKGAAIVRENGVGCRRNITYNRWWYGHMIASYGLINGVRVAWKPAINIGLVALSDTAPHWEAWIRDYRRMIVERSKTNLDQHAFNAALELNHLPAAEISPRCNWICTLSPPVWNPDTKMFCEPDSTARPLSVLHLAGPDKRRTYHLKQTNGATISTALTWTVAQELKGKTPDNN